ncbi:10370_t:CDS:1, partial [Racocetra fulgida]
MPIVLQATMPEGTNAQVDAFQANSDTNTTDSTSQDWLEIMEREAAAENQQVPPEDNNFRKENSTATDIEGSGNLCDDRAGETTSHDLHLGTSHTNVVAEPSIEGKPKNKTHSQETKSWSGLFTKLTRGRATYSTFSPRANISTKNRNALLFDIQRLNQISTNDIVATLYGKMGGDFIGAKPHFVKGT